ncbi:MAG: hypothetical protein JST48_14075 [Bacteroidetes bacterium]|nr:hypothetical protein [Bacteroidota bacterium]
MESIKISDEQLLSYLDGNGTDAERKALIEKIANNQTHLNRLKELEAVHLILKNQAGVEQLSKVFTNKVMAGLHRQVSSNLLSPKNGLLLLIGLVIASALALLLASTGVFDQWHTLINFNNGILKTDWVKTPTVSYDIKFVVKIIVMINALLALILLDRTILRPLFQKRADRLGL